MLKKDVDFISALGYENDDGVNVQGVPKVIVQKFGLIARPVII